MHNILCPVCSTRYENEPIADIEVICISCESKYYIVEDNGSYGVCIDKGRKNIPAIYIDLDGTLAKHGQWKGIEHIGEPIERMLQKLFIYLDEGYRVKIFTARANVPESIPHITKWLEQFGLGDLEVTNIKGFDMVRMYDDRAVAVIPNEGPEHLF